MGYMMRKRENLASFVSICASMLIFGSIGIFRKYLPVPSGFLALSRAVTGALFLLAVTVLGRRRIDKASVKRNLPLLCMTGVCLGANWILLFEAFEYTSVSVATLCYYMAPVIIILSSALFLREGLTIQKVLCSVGALFGMILVSGIASGEMPGKADSIGILLGLCAAVLYASVVIINKKITDISPYDKTVVQLSAAAVVMLPYVLICEDVSAVTFDVRMVILLAVVGIVHTGIAYALYFGALRSVKAQSAALISYVDPASALVMSAVFLGERLEPYGIIGAVLILVFAAMAEIDIGAFIRKKVAK